MDPNLAQVLTAGITGLVGIVGTLSAVALHFLDKRRDRDRDAQSASGRALDDRRTAYVALLSTIDELRALQAGAVRARPRFMMDTAKVATNYTTSRVLVEFLASPDAWGKMKPCVEAASAVSNLELARATNDSEQVAEASAALSQLGAEDETGWSALRSQFVEGARIDLDSK